MKIRLFFFTAMVGLLMVSNSSVVFAGYSPSGESSSCDIAFVGTPEKVTKVFNIAMQYAGVPGDKKLAYTDKYAMFLHALVKKECSERFALLPQSLQDNPREYFEFLLNKKRLKDVMYRSNIHTLMMNGIPLRLPKLEKAKMAKAVEIKQQLVVEINTNKDGVVNPDTQKRLNELEKLTADVPELRKMYETLSGAFARQQRGELTGAQKSNISEEVSSQLKKALVVVNRRIANLQQSDQDQNLQIQELIKSDQDQVQQLHDLDSRVAAAQKTADENGGAIKDLADQLEEFVTKAVQAEATGFTDRLDKVEGWFATYFWAMVVLGLLVVISIALWVINLIKRRNLEFSERRDHKALADDVDVLKGRVDQHDKTFIATNNAVRDMEDQVAMLLMDGYVADPSNPTRAELANHVGGKSKPLTLRFTREETGEVYTILAWRDENTEKGLVCLDLPRKKGLSQLISPASLNGSKLVGSIRRAIDDGRLPPDGSRKVVEKTSKKSSGPAKKRVAKKATAKKTVSKKATAKKTVAKKTAGSKSSETRVPVCVSPDEM